MNWLGIAHLNVGSHTANSKHISLAKVIQNFENPKLPVEKTPEVKSESLFRRIMNAIRKFLGLTSKLPETMLDDVVSAVERYVENKDYEIERFHREEMLRRKTKQAWENIRQITRTVKGGVTGLNTLKTNLGNLLEIVNDGNRIQLLDEKKTLSLLKQVLNDADYNSVEKLWNDFDKTIPDSFQAWAIHRLGKAKDIVRKLRTVSEHLNNTETLGMVSEFLADKSKIEYTDAEMQAWNRWNKLAASHNLLEGNKPFFKIGIIGVFKTRKQALSIAKEYRSIYPDISVHYNNFNNSWVVNVNDNQINAIRDKINSYRLLDGEEVQENETVLKNNDEIVKHERVLKNVNTLFPNPVDVNDITDEIIRLWDESVFSLEEAEPDRDRKKIIIEHGVNEIKNIIGSLFEDMAEEHPQHAYSIDKILDNLEDFLYLAMPGISKMEGLTIKQDVFAVRDNMTETLKDLEDGMEETDKDGWMINNDEVTLEDSMTEKTMRLLRNMRMMDSRTTVMGTPARIPMDIVKNGLIDVICNKATSSEDFMDALESGVKKYPFIGQLIKNIQAEPEYQTSLYKTFRRDYVELQAVIYQNGKTTMKNLSRRYDAEDKLEEIQKTLESGINLREDMRLFRNTVPVSESGKNDVQDADQYANLPRYDVDSGLESTASPETSGEYYVDIETLNGIMKPGSEWKKLVDITRDGNGNLDAIGINIADDVDRGLKGFKRKYQWDTIEDYIDVVAKYLNIIGVKTNERLKNILQKNGDINDLLTYTG
ncbi:MAG: hypothetical protein LBE56_12840 [Tannerella sp.]|nr:hypothetical protein [Tannerella sp.]